MTAPAVDRDQRAHDVEPACEQLVAAVRALDPGKVANALSHITDQAAALVVLAAMVTEAAGTPLPAAAGPDDQGKVAGPAVKPKPKRKRVGLRPDRRRKLLEEGAALAWTPDKGWHCIEPDEADRILARVE